jgi:hypothetical protein
MANILLVLKSQIGDVFSHAHAQDSLSSASMPDNETRLARRPIAT